jgi:septal ring factor EnvC (AmiA/AmiB activator)
MLLVSASVGLPQDPLPATMSQLEEQIQRLRAEIEAATARKDQLARNQSQREAYLQEVGIQISAGEQLLTAYARDIGQKTAQAEELRGQIDTLGREMERLEEAVAPYVVGLYKHGRRRMLEVVLGGDSFTDSIRRLRAVTIVAAREQESVDRLAASRSEQMEKRTEITRTIDALQQRRRDQRAEQERLNQAKADAAAELGRIALDQEQLRQRMEEANAALIQLINQQMELRRQRLARGIPSDLALGGFGEMHGNLLWPLDSRYGEGEVVRGFGRHMGRDNTVTTSPGVDILAPNADSDVLAVHNGEVLFVEWIAHLGMVAVLYHGDDYVTAYSNVEGLAIMEEDPVPVGFRIGGVGEALRPVGQDVDGRLLRFSIFKGDTAIDPMPWFGGRR